MKLVKLSEDIEFKTGVRRISQVIIAVLLLISFMLATKLATSTTTHRETMVPPDIKRSFWVEDDKISNEYLEEMGLFLLQLALNNTPASVDYNVSVLLKYAAPASYGSLEVLTADTKRRLKENNSSTIFSARAVTPYDKRRAVAFSGVMTTYISDKKSSEESATYLVQLGYSHGKTYLVQISKVDPKTPFGDLIDEKAPVPESEQLQLDQKADAEKPNGV